MAGFDAAVMEFKRWVCLLLLDGLQRAGLFRTRGESHTLDGLRGRVASDYARFIEEALAILQQHGGIPLCTFIHILHCCPFLFVYLCEICG